MEIYRVRRQIEKKVTALLRMSAFMQKVWSATATGGHFVIHTWSSVFAFLSSSNLLKEIRQKKG